MHRLRGAFVFAMTRSLTEADSVVDRRDASLVWGCGVHPGSQKALESYDPTRFATYVDNFVLIGEIGLDGRSPDHHRQLQVLRSILRATQRAPVLLSLHSAGRAAELVDLLAEQPRVGAILHWFTGDEDSVHAAYELGCYFSVNSAMSDEALARIPFDRMLPETDFPQSRARTRARMPGDIGQLESRVAGLVDLPSESVRRQWYRNLRTLALAAGVMDRLPVALADCMLIA